MEKNLSVNQKKATKSKKKPVKVVYITNPMKVQTSASGFRALVQELTGQDADVEQPPSKLSETDNGVGGGGGQASTDDAAVKAAMEDHHHHHHHHHHAVVLETPPAASVPSETLPKDYHPFHEFDNVDLTTPPQMMLENFTGFVPSNYWYETTSHVDMF